MDKKPWALWLAAGVGMAALCAGAWTYYSGEAGQEILRARMVLSAIGETRASQVADWRDERLSEVTSAAKGILGVEFRAWRADPEGPRQATLRATLARRAREADAESFVLAAPDGTVLFAYPTRPAGLAPQQRWLIARAVSSGRGVTGELLSLPDERTTVLDTAAPILDAGGRASAVLLLRSSAMRRLLPSVAIWPGGPLSAEVVIARREGEEAVLISCMREGRLGSSEIRVPLVKTEVPAVRAVLGMSGHMEGDDYAGREVFAYSRGIPRSGWSLVIKAERRELLKQSRYRGFVALLFCLMSLGLLAFAITLSHSSRRRLLQESLLRAQDQEKEGRLRLAQSEEKFRRIAESARDAIVTCDPGGRVSYWNPGAERIFGYAAGEALGRDLRDLVAPEAQRRSWERAFPSFLRTGEGELTGATTEVIARGKDGRLIDGSLSISAIDLKEGWNAIAVFRDTTAEKAAVRDLAMFKAISDNAGYGVAIVDAAGAIVYINRYFAEVHGYLAEELLGKNLSLFHAEERGLTGAAYSGVEMRHRRRDGATFPMLMSGVPISSESGAPRLFATLGVDMTKHRALEEELLQAQKMESVGRLAGGVAHDFNNLLTAIRGYAQFLLESLRDGDSRADDAREIIAASERAAQLTQHLLAFSRKQVLQPTVVDLNEIVRDMGKLLGRVIGEHIALDIRLAAHPCVIKADRSQLEQILMNLATNARDAMAAGGRLEITTEHSPREVRLSVRDNGTGIAPAALPHIFEPFFTTKAKGKGTGLGLATVYGVTKQSGGEVKVESFPGRGTEFRFSFPLAKEVSDAEAVIMDALARSEDCRGSETILLVEDEGAVRAIAEKSLRSAGYAVVAVAGGAQALEALSVKGFAPAALVTDLVMPGMSGRDVARRTAALHPGLRTLYMSGYSDSAFGEGGHLPEDTAFLAKPFTPAALLRKVRAVLDASPDLSRA